MRFELVLPKSAIFGCGTFQTLGRAAKDFGRKALLVTGKKSMERAGFLDRAVKCLKEFGIKAFIFNKVFPEPDLDIVQAGIEMAREEACDFVIGLGGGSALDVAKAVAALVNEKRPLHEFQSGAKIQTSGLPFVAIPTTHGTGSEATFNSVIIDRVKGVKRSIRDPRMMADLCILDPELTLTLGRDWSLIGIIDTLVHLVEGFFSRGANLFTDSLARLGIEMVWSRIGEIERGGLSDVSFREEMLAVSFLGGVVLSNAGLGAAHGLGSSLGVRFGIPHGVAVGILLPWVLEFNRSVCQEKMDELATLLFGAQGERLEDVWIEVARRLKSLGFFDLVNIDISNEDATFIIEKASGSIRNNPRQGSKDEYREVLMAMSRFLKEEKDRKITKEKR